MWNSISSWQLCHAVRVKKCKIHVWQHCRRMYHCVLLYTWLFLRVRPSQKCPLQCMSIYSNENIRKIVKLSPHKFLHLVQNRENYGVYSMWSRSALPVCTCCECMGHSPISVWFWPLKIREKKCFRNGKSFVEWENYVAYWLHEVLGAIFRGVSFIFFNIKFLVL